MKVKMIVFVLFASFLMFGGMGCKKKQDINYVDINVSYTNCENSIHYPIDGVIERKGILLFNLINTQENEIIDNFHSTRDFIEYIIYDQKSTDGSTIIYKKVQKNKGGTGNESGAFCNFPVDIKTWIIPKTGLYISFSGDFINTKFTTDANYSTYNIILKSLKKQKQ